MELENLAESRPIEQVVSTSDVDAGDLIDSGTNGTRPTNNSTISVDTLETEPVYPIILAEGPFTFASLKARRAADAAAMEVRDLAYNFQDLAWSIFNSPDVDTVAAMRELADEFVALVAEAVGVIEESNDLPAPDLSEAQPITMEESESVTVIAIADLAEATGSDTAPLQLDVAVIEPGWGNKRDNHYYPAEMLKECASAFEGAKMYATNHVAEEKNVLTEVSQVLACPVGFTDSGAPIARIGIFNEDFATSIRNRAALDTLDSLHVSILANGLARPGFEQDGREGKIIESITDVASIDWVTSAGAGGRALQLAETDAGEKESNMAKEKDTLPTGDTKTTESAGDPTPDEIADIVETVTVVETDATQPGDTGLQEEEGTADNQPTALSEDDVQATLKEATLPDVSRARLATAQYQDQSALDTAVANELAYIEALTGAGRPLGQAVTDQKAQQPDKDALTAELDEIDAGFGLRS